MARKRKSRPVGEHSVGVDRRAEAGRAGPVVADRVGADRRAEAGRGGPVVDDIGGALARLAEVGQLLRRRLDAIDPIEQGARWAGVNDQIRALDDRIGRLRDEQQRVALVGTELIPLGTAELEGLRAAVSELAELVRAAAGLALVIEATARVADATGVAIARMRKPG
jgi:hypothetical protein